LDALSLGELRSIEQEKEGMPPLHMKKSG